MNQVVISGTGLYTPNESISNEELVKAFNAYVQNYNQTNQAAIANGDLDALKESSAEFIEKASGIKSRYIMEKNGVLDPEVMHPIIEERPITQTSRQCDMAVAAGEEALARAGKTAKDIDAVILACAGMERLFPAVAIEVQQALGIEGYAYDMNVACSSATFAVQAGMDAIAQGHARAVLIVNPEICTSLLNFRDRDSHFIFGDVCTALVLEREDLATSAHCFKIIGSKLQTNFSNNIRSNYGILNRCAPGNGRDADDKLFSQQGRRVFKEVIPMASEMIAEHLAELSVSPSSLKRLWLHQANISMNRLIANRVLGRDATPEEAPVILDEYANTASAGSVIAMHKYQDDLQSGDLALLCSFGAGYSIGNIVLEKR